MLIFSRGRQREKGSLTHISRGPIGLRAPCFDRARHGAAFDSIGNMADAEYRFASGLKRSGYICYICLRLATAAPDGFFAGAG